MMLPILMGNPLLYYFLKAAAIARHKAVGMPDVIHRSLMDTFYPL